MPRRAYRYREIKSVSSTQKQEYPARSIDRIKQAENRAGSEYKIRFRHVDSLTDPATRLNEGHAPCRAHQPARPLQPVARTRRTQKLGVELHGNRAAIQIAKHRRRRQTVGQRT